MAKFNSMGTTKDTWSVKKWYPKWRKANEYWKNEYIEQSPIDPEIDEDFYPEVVEDAELVNQNDPFVIEKRKRAFAKKHGREVYDVVTKDFESKDIAPRKKIHKVSWEVEFTKWDEYVGRVIDIDDFKNATIVINGEKGIVYNASKRGLLVWDKRNVLFARKNKKGKCVFELPKNPKDMLADYYTMYADGMEKQEILKKLFSRYGYQKIKEKLTTVVDPELLEKTREEYKKAA